MKGVGIDDVLVENDFVSLGFFDCFRGSGVSVPFDLVWIVYRDGSWFLEWCSNFVDDVNFEKVKVQLGLPARVEGESAYRTFHFSV